MLASAIAFQVLKANVEWYIAKYGQENIPPPAQLFTLANGANEGANVHLVQKVFEGAFEVILARCIEPARLIVS